VSCNLPIATSGETSSSPQVFPKGPIVRVCWCIVRVNPGSSLCQQSGLVFIYFSLCISPTRCGYKKLGLEPIESLQYRSHRARKKPMGDKNKYHGVVYPIKMFLEEALTQKMNEMMGKFKDIL
jgi:hypothetical protein